MARLGGVRFVAVLGTLTLMAGVFGVGVGSTPAGASTYTNVNTEAGLRTAFGDSSATLIDLTANITLTNCGAGPVSRSSSTALVVNGDSHTVTQTCPDSVFSQALAGSLTFQNITITGGDINGALLEGGGIFAGSSVTVTNSTITANSLTGGTLSVVQGGGIYAGGTVTLVYATIVDNTAATAANIAGELTSFGSVVAQPLGGGANCGLSLTTSHGYNLEDDAGASCGFSTGTDDLAPGTNPDLGPLGSNGGPTQTMVPNIGSPLINAIPNGSCESDGASGIMTDQRDFPRPSPAGGACDIGAVEVQSTTLAASARATQNLLEGIVIFNATLTSQATGQPIVGQMVKFTAGGASCTATTNSRGVATCDVVGPLFVFVRIHSFTATFLGSVGYLPSTTTGTIHS
jgi:hypothetical protein